MANGKTHTVASLVSAAVGAGALYWFTGDVELALWTAVGGAVTLLVNPDTDLEGIDHNEHRLVRNTCGCGFVWLALWYPYAALFRHRGVSHMPVLGTLTRVAYLAGLCLAAALVVRAVWPGQPEIDWSVVDLAASGLIAGMVLSDLVHWALDVV